MNEMMICLICLLIFKMGIAETNYSFIPSKIYMEKKIKMDDLNAKFEILKTSESRDSLMNEIVLRVSFLKSQMQFICSIVRR